MIARFWIIHRLAFRLIARDDGVLVWLNLLLLMCVAFLPFPAAVLGAHGGSSAAALLYASSVILAAIASAAYWWYASGRGNLLRPGVGRARVRALRARGISSPIFFALTLPLAFFAPFAAEIVWILIFPLTRLVFAWFFAGESESGLSRGQTDGGGPRAGMPRSRARTRRWPTGRSTGSPSTGRHEER